MNTIKIRLDNDLSKAISFAVEEFNYSTKEEFVIDAIRQRLHNSKMERDKISAWNRLLQAPRRLISKKWIDSEDFRDFEYRPRFGLKDLLKQRLENQAKEEEPKLWT